MLKVLAHPVKQHDAYGFREFPDDDSTQSSKAHQEVFVKNTAFNNVLSRGFQNFPTKNQIGSAENGNGGICRPGYGNILQNQTQEEQSRTGQDGQQPSGAFVVMGIFMFLLLTVVMATAAARLWRQWT